MSAEKPAPYHDPKCTKPDGTCDCKDPSELSPAHGSEMLLWRCGWGRISAKPVKCLELGDDYIKVVGSCMIKQKRDDRHESYHATYKEAMMRLLTNAQRELNEAEMNLAAAKRRLKSAQTKWSSYVASPNSEIRRVADDPQPQNL